MISFEIFKETINYAKRKDEADSRFHEMLREYHDVYQDGMMPVDAATTIIIQLLEAAMDLPINDLYGSTLSWWCWEKDYGESFKVGDIVINSLPEDDPNRTPDLSTVEGLYKFLLREAENGKTKTP